MGSNEDLERLRHDGFVVQHDVFTAEEVAALRETVERVAQDVTLNATRPDAGPEVELPDGHRIQFSSAAAIQWEWLDGSEQIRIIEPIDHLDAPLLDLFAEPRLADFAATALGVDRVAPFTSKLNLKRAREGSRFPCHQDFPY